MRIHLFELEDQPWLPRLVRDAGTAYLELAARLSGHAEAIVPVLREALEASGEREILDLCSGGTGPLPAALDQLAEISGIETSATLSDLYPNREAFARASQQHPRVTARLEPLDAAQVPAELPGLRTLFNGFHHFRPADARRILADAARRRRSILAVEVLARHPLALSVVVVAPILSLLALPFLRPFRWGWLPLTYLVPVIPLFIAWDGFVSCLRCYSPAELQQLTESVGAEDYEWRIGSLRTPGAPFSSTTLLGTPRPPDSPSPPASP